MKQVNIYNVNIVGAFLSFPVYIIVNNILIVLDKLLHCSFRFNSMLYIFGEFCNTYIPVTDKQYYFAVFVLLKYLLVAFVLVYSRRKENTFYQFLRLQTILFLLIDLFVFLFIAIDKITGSQTTGYFISSAFLMGFSQVNFKSFLLLPLINGIIGCYFLYKQYVSVKWTAVVFLLSLLSILVTCFFMYIRYA